MQWHLIPSRVTLFFGRYLELMTGESNHSFSLFQHTPKTFNGVKVRTLWWPIHVFKWLLLLPSFTTRALWILALSRATRMPSFSIFKELTLAVPRPDQLKQPQIITLQFADQLYANIKSIWCIWRQKHCIGFKIQHLPNLTSIYTAFPSVFYPITDRDRSFCWLNRYRYR